MNAQLIRTFRVHDTRVTAMSTVSEGERFVSGATDGSLRIGSLLHDDALFTTQMASSVTTITAFKDSYFVVTGYQDGNIILLNAETGETVRTIRGHDGKVTSLVVSDDGKTVLSSSEDGSIRIWDSVSGQELQKFGDDNETTRSMTLLPDSTAFVSSETTTDGQNTLRIRTLAQTEDNDNVRDFAMLDTDVKNLGFDASGNYLVTISEDGDITLWAWEDGSVERTIETNTGISTALLMPNKRHTLLGTHQSKLTIWNIETGKHIYTFDTPSDRVTSTAISPDNHYVLAGCRDGMMNVYQLLG